MFVLTSSLLAAGACLRDFIRKPNWSDAIWFILFFSAGAYFQLALVGQILQDVKAMSYV